MNIEPVPYGPHTAEAVTKEPVSALPTDPNNILAVSAYEALKAGFVLVNIDPVAYDAVPKSDPVIPRDTLNDPVKLNDPVTNTEPVIILLPILVCDPETINDPVIDVIEPDVPILLDAPNTEKDPLIVIEPVTITF